MRPRGRNGVSRVQEKDETECILINVGIKIIPKEHAKQAHIL